MFKVKANKINWGGGLIHWSGSNIGAVCDHIQEIQPTVKPILKWSLIGISLASPSPSLGEHKQFHLLNKILKGKWSNTGWESLRTAGKVQSRRAGWDGLRGMWRSTARQNSF